MPERTPAVAGRFYPAGAEEALAAIESLASQAGRLADRIGPWDPPAKSPRIVMLPHAGWIFSGLATMAALAGGIFLIWTDVLARVIIPNSEIPIGVITSAIGAPIFVYMMIKKSYGFGGADR